MLETSLYRPGHLEPGHSEKVDEAIDAVRQHLVVGIEAFDREEFQTAWNRLLEALVSEFPNISARNLVILEMGLTNHDLNLENLVICRWVAELLPKSSESQCFLAHAYRRVRDLDSSAMHYKQASDMAIAHADKRGLSADAAIRIDASDYLRNLSEVEIERGRLADALMYATQALSILTADRSMFKHVNIYKVFERIYRQMGQDELAESHRLQAEEAESKIE